jgi:hypothetical protein
MKTYSALLLLTASAVFAAVLEERAGCNADNCLRAVRATARLAIGSSDCSSFLATATTVTPTSTYVVLHLRFS